MLVLSRKPGQSIRIGDAIEVKITAVEGNIVKIGIEAPAHIPIHRSELVEEIKRENLLASQQTKPDEIASLWESLKQSSIDNKT
jgi:carbon storage regulator